MTTWCLFNNVLKEDEKLGTPAWQRRHESGINFGGRLVAFDAKIHYLPTAARELEQRQKAAPRMVEGFFAGYKLLHDARWSGE